MTKATITLAPADASDPSVTETHFEWEDHEVILRLTAADPPFGIGPPNAGGEVTLFARDLTWQLDGVQHKGPHTWPIVYRATPSAATIKAGDSVTVTLKERHRISAWAEATSLVRKVAGGQADMRSDDSFGDRKRRNYYQLPGWLDDLAGLDDVSVVSTVFFNSAGDDIDWARNLLQDTDDSWDPNSDDAKANPDSPANKLGASNLARHVDFNMVRLRFMRELIEACHARRIQVFAGFYVDSGNGNAASIDHSARMMKFVRGTADPVVMAGKLAAFFARNELEVDGVWFDFEVDKLNPRPRGATAFTTDDRPRIEAWVRAVADEFGKRGRYVAFAAAPDRNGQMQNHFFSHPADLAQYPNVLCRPMSYDSRPKTVGDVTVLCDSTKAGSAFVTPVQPADRVGIAKRCLGFYGLHPAQLQIAVGHCSNESSGEVRGKLGPGATEARALRIGLIHWNLGGPDDAREYATCDANLNGPDPIPRGTLGQPIQGPLNAERVKVLDDAVARAKPAP